jgi:hypothetical protein
MPRYRIVTLVDITRTNVSKSDHDQKLISQQANFNSLIQAIGMRSNVEWQIDPIKKDGRLPLPFKGSAAHWIWEFEVERDQIFEKDTDPVGLLKEDLHGVPIISDLENTTEICPPVFSTIGENSNISVEII